MFNLNIDQTVGPGDFKRENKKDLPSQNEQLIDENHLIAQVELLTALNNSFADVLPEAKHYVDENINHQEIEEKAAEIVHSIVLIEDELLSNEDEIDSEIDEIMSKSDDDRQEALDEFIRKLEEDYENEFRTIDNYEGFLDKFDKTANFSSYIAYKTTKFEGLVANYVNIGRKLGEAMKVVQESSAEHLEIITSVALPVAKWINLGVECQKAFTISSKISFLKDQLASTLALLNSGQISAEDASKIVEKVHHIEDEIKNLTAENKEKLDELGETLVETILTSFESSAEVLSNNVVKSLIADTTHILEGSLDIANVCANAGVVAGSAILLGISIYGTINSSAELSALKNNMRQIEAEQAKEKDPLKAVILQTKLDRLAQLHQDYALKISKKSFEAVIGSLALTASVEGVLTAAGVTLGASAAMCLNASGIGALAMFGAVTAGSAAYGVYRNRHEIQYALASGDISLHQQLVKYQLASEMRIYNKANTVFKESQKTLEGLQLLIPAAWDAKLAIDAERGPGALAKQKQISHVYTNLTRELTEVTEAATAASLTMAVSLPKIREMQKNQRILLKKQELEDTKLKRLQLAVKFSKYDVKTLEAVHSAIDDFLKTPGGKDKIKKMMISHGFNPPESMNVDHVFDYILDSSAIVLPNFGLTSGKDVVNAGSSQQRQADVVSDSGSSVSREDLQGQSHLERSIVKETFTSSDATQGEATSAQAGVKTVKDFVKGEGLSTKPVTITDKEGNSLQLPRQFALDLARTPYMSLNDKIIYSNIDKDNYDQGVAYRSLKDALGGSDNAMSAMMNLITQGMFADTLVHIMQAGEKEFQEPMVIGENQALDFQYKIHVQGDDVKIEYKNSYTLLDFETQVKGYQIAKRECRLSLQELQQLNPNDKESNLATISVTDTYSEILESQQLVSDLYEAF